MSRTLAIFGIKLKKDLQSSLIKKEKEKAAKYGNSANGNSRLFGTIKIAFDNNDNPDIVSLTMEDYWYWINGGRKPGKVSNKGLESIESWIKRKGINPVARIAEMKKVTASKNLLTNHIVKPRKNFVAVKPLDFKSAVIAFGFMVRNKERHKGFEGNHFYDEVINDGRLVQLKKDLAIEYKKDITIVINGNNNSSGTS